MASIEDIQTMRLVKQEFNRSQIDTTKADIKVFKGVVHVRGGVKSLKNRSTDLKKEIQIITRRLRTRTKIKDVVFEAEFAY